MFIVFFSKCVEPPFFDAATGYSEFCICALYSVHCTMFIGEHVLGEIINFWTVSYNYQSTKNSFVVEI